MAYCPKCGASVGTEKECPYCGASLLAPSKNDSNENIQKLKEYTSDFKEKPKCSDSDFKETTVQALVTSTAGEKALYETRIKAYSDNYLQGGTGVVVVPPKSEYARSGAEASDASGAIAGVAAGEVGTASSKGSKSGKPFIGGVISKKAFIIIVASVAGLAVAGTTAGIIASKASGGSKNQTYVTFEDNGGHGGPGNMYLTYNEYPENLSSNYLPIRDGYTFTGYYSGTSSYSTQYFNESGIAVRSWTISSSSYTLYAHWETISYETTVTFDPNGGVNPYGSLVRTLNYNYTPSGIGAMYLPDREGYIFLGYFDGTDPTTATKYFNQNGSPLRYWDKPLSTYTLYAGWQEYSYSTSQSPLWNQTHVTFINNGGYGGPSSIDLKTGAWPDDLDSIPWMNGYTFQGYYDENNVRYFNEVGTAVHLWDKVDSSCYLYANWVINSSSTSLPPASTSEGGITQIGTSESGTTQSVTSESSQSSQTYVSFYYGDECLGSYYISYGSMSSLEWDNLDTWIIGEASSYGYTFLGFYNEDGDMYFDSEGNSCQSWDVNYNSYSLYAHMQAPGTTVTFDDNGGQGGPGSQNYEYGSHPSQVSTPVRNGYTFLGYFDSTDLYSSTKYFDNNGTPLCVWDKTDAAVTLYALWDPKSTTVYIDLCRWPNDCDFSTTIFFDQESNVYGNAPYYDDNHTFIGFFDSDDIKYFNENCEPVKSWDKTISQCTLYAHWMPTGTYSFNAANLWGDNVSGQIDTWTSSLQLDFDNFEYSSSGLNDVLTGTFCPQSGGYLFSEFNGYFALSKDNAIAWTNYSHSSSIGNDTYVMINQDLLNSNCVVKYLRYGNPSNFNNEYESYLGSSAYFDESCDLILVDIKIDDNSKFYLLGNNQIYADVEISCLDFDYNGWYWDDVESLDDIGVNSTVRISYYYNGHREIRNGTPV